MRTAPTNEERGTSADDRTVDLLEKGASDNSSFQLVNSLINLSIVWKVSGGIRQPTPQVSYVKSDDRDAFRESMVVHQAARIASPEG